MPIYENIPTVDMTFPEQVIYNIWAHLPIQSVLDVGAGHGGPLANDIILQNPNILHRMACDIHWIRDLDPRWQSKVGVDVHELDKHFAPRSWDLVGCYECLEHVTDPRLALEQLIKVANQCVIFTSADEEHHQGPEQEAIEKVNPHQAYIKQPSLSDLYDLGFTVFVDAGTRRQLIGYKYV